MELYISNVSWTSTLTQVKLEVAKVLHSPPYLTDPLTNFDVRLFPDKRRGGHSHGGNGALTLPNEALGVQFLQIYGNPTPTRVIKLGNRFIRFEKSRRVARRDVVDTIRHLPYEDPLEREERQRRADTFKESTVSIRTIQFGWECRDSVLSIEWEKKDFIDACAIILNDDPRELRVKYFGPHETRIIAIRFSQIAWSATSLSVQGQPAITLSLHEPPSYESEITPERMDYLLRIAGPRFKGTVYDIEPRKRLSAFEDGQAQVAPYASLIRLVCQADIDVLQFRKMARLAKLTEPQDFDYPLEYRQIFSHTNLHRLQSWLKMLDFEVAFQVEALTRCLVLDVQETLSLRGDIDDLVLSEGPEYTSAFLRSFSGQARKLFWEYNDSKELKETVEQCFQRTKESFKLPTSRMSALPNGEIVFDCLHVTVTPTTIILDGPFPERSNRVIRSYPGLHFNFLRVSFADESRLQYRFDRQVDGRHYIRERVGGALLNGLAVAGSFFKFLAYSQSALKEHAVWFVRPFYDDDNRRVDAPIIIKSIGNFADLSFDPMLIYCPARYGARISQAFTATESSVAVEVEEIFPLADVEVPKFVNGIRKGTWSFTDGVGTMSKSLAQEIWREIKAKTRRGKRMKVYPRAIQVRFGGSKGMLSVDHTLLGRAICLRASMIKFDSPQSREIEVARAFDKPGGYWLNRPLIMLLEGLGVPYSTFKRHQDNAVEQVEESTNSLEQAARMLEAYGLGGSYRLPSIMLSLHKLGLQNVDDRFYHQSLEFAVHHVLRELKQHARIPIPGGWTLVGVADVHGFLKEGEVFACFKHPKSGSTVYLEGRQLISRSPTIHPGDVQVVKAIGRPPEGSCFAKERLMNTVVFSIRGARPLPSCLGGGDLDGDTYNLLPLKDLPEFTPYTTHAPAMYDAAPRKLLDRPSTMDDVAEFFTEYITSDVLGIVAINWLLIADQSDRGIFDPDCLKLSDIHSDAVDFPKSGQPVALSDIPPLKFKAKPDWNAPETVTRDTERFYQSKRAIGRLFRSIELPAVQKMKAKARRERRQPREGRELSLEEALADLRLNQRDDGEEDEDEDIIRILVQRHIHNFIDTQPLEKAIIEEVLQLFNRYASELLLICITSSLTRSAILTEEEASVGTIAAKCSQSRRRKDMMAKLREHTNTLVSSIREDLLGDEEFPLEEGLMRAWVAWEMSVAERDEFGGNSFGWVALGAIFEAIRDIEERDKEGSRY